MHGNEWLFGGISVQDSVVRLLRKDTELPAANTVVIVMGLTGAGKSRFIREATGEAVEIRDTL
jgi:ABC-type proline/glycine betaine transport system ATPase subunit